MDLPEVMEIHQRSVFPRNTHNTIMYLLQYFQFREMCIFPLRNFVDCFTSISSCEKFGEKCIEIKLTQASFAPQLTHPPMKWKERNIEKWILSFEKCTTQCKVHCNRIGRESLSSSFSSISSSSRLLPLALVLQPTHPPMKYEMWNFEFDLNMS